MLTEAQITAGAARLVGNQLKPVDVDQLVSIFRMFFAELETKYSYDYKARLEALTDGDNSYQTCAQIAACLIKLEELGFGVASLDGDLKYREKDEYAQYVLIAFSKIYKIPFEWSQYDLRRRRTGTLNTQTLWTTRTEV